MILHERKIVDGSDRQPRVYTIHITTLEISTVSDYDSTDDTTSTNSDTDSDTDSDSNSDCAHADLTTNNHDNHNPTTDTEEDSDSEPEHPANKPKHPNKTKSSNTEISRNAVVKKMNSKVTRRRLGRSCKRTTDYSEFF